MAIVLLVTLGNRVYQTQNTKYKIKETSQGYPSEAGESIYYFDFSYCCFGGFSVDRRPATFYQSAAITARLLALYTAYFI